MLFASAPTLDAIKESIARFYGGEGKTLEQVNDHEWTIHHSDGAQLIGVRVFKRGKRFRFETVI